MSEEINTAEKVENPVEISVEAPVEAVEPTEATEKVEEIQKKQDPEEATKESKEESKEGTEAPEYKEFSPQDVLKQVEFYFSDSNLPKDKFLWRTVQSNQEGWVSIATIASFNRMKKFRPLSAVVDALRTSEFLVVSEDGELVRRKNAILPPKDSEKQLRFQRSVYAKGFDEETETTQEDLEKWFQQYGKVNEVRLRRNEEKAFKKSVFVEFADLEDAKKFVELSPKPEYEGRELEVVMSKPAYVEMKAQNENFGGNKNFKRKRFNGFKHGHKRQRRD
jgi:lupus La protein